MQRKSKQNQCGNEQDFPDSKRRLEIKNVRIMTINEIIERSSFGNPENLTNETISLLR